MARSTLSCPVCLAGPERVLGPKLGAELERFDARAVSWLRAHSVALLRISLGVVFLWFGALKFFPGLSPAQELATRTLGVLSFGLVPPGVAIVVLAAWECAIGAGLLLGEPKRLTLLLLWAQMLGTFTPALLFPHEVFTHLPYAPTLEGQYIIKNLVLISAGLVIGATVRARAKRAACSC